MSKLGDALTRAHELLKAVRVRFKSEEEVQDGVPRWTWVAAELSKAIGEFENVLLRLKEEEVPAAPTQEELDPASFEERLDKGEKALEHARKTEQQWAAFSAGMEETEPDDASHDTGVVALQHLYRLRDIAQHHAPAG